MLDSELNKYTNNSRITINGGTVTANGGDYGAGLGSGSCGGGGTIVINNGTFTGQRGVRARASAAVTWRALVSTIPT